MPRKKKSERTLDPVFVVNHDIPKTVTPKITSVFKVTKFNHAIGIDSPWKSDDVEVQHDDVDMSHLPSTTSGRKKGSKKPLDPIFEVVQVPVEKTPTTSVPNVTK